MSKPQNTGGQQRALDSLKLLHRGAEQLPPAERTKVKRKVRSLETKLKARHAAEAKKAEKP